MINHNSDNTEYTIYGIEDADWRIPAGYVDEFIAGTKGNPEYKNWYSKKDYLKLAALSLMDDAEVPPELLERITSLHSKVGEVEESEKVYREINRLRNSISYSIKKCIATLDFDTRHEIIRNRPIIRDLLMNLEPKFRELIGDPLPEIGQNESFKLMPKQFQQKLVLDLNDFVNELKEEMGVSVEELYEEIKISPWNIKKVPQIASSETKKDEPPKPKEKYTLVTADFIQENMGLLYRSRISPAKEALKDLYFSSDPTELDVMERYGFSEEETVTATKGKNMIDEVLLNLVDLHSTMQQSKYKDSKIQWFKNIFDTNQSGPAKVLSKFYGQISGIKLFKLDSTEEVLTNFGMRKETIANLERTDVYILKFNTKSTGKHPVSHLVPICIASAPPLDAGKPIKVRQIALTGKSEYMMQLATEISKNQAIVAREVIPIFRG